MEVRVQFDEPLLVSAQDLDRVSVTFNTQGLLYDRFGSEIEQGFTTNKYRVPKQYAGETEAQFSKSILIIGQTIEIEEPLTRFMLNTLIAGALQQILSAISSSEIIVLIPFFDINMPADVDAYFTVLL